jgi:hypothetical protein
VLISVRCALEQASDTASSRTRMSSLAVALLLHALPASMSFHKEARRRDLPFYYPYHSLFSVWVVMQCHQLPLSRTRIPPLRSITLVNSAFGHGSRFFLGFSALTFSWLLTPRSASRTGYERNLSTLVL